MVRTFQGLVGEPVAGTQDAPPGYWKEISRKVKPNRSDYRNRRAFVDLFGRGSS